jgi:TM2 domain
MSNGAPKSWLVAVLFSVFLGSLGVDRFYLGLKQARFSVLGKGKTVKT